MKHFEERRDQIIAEFALCETKESIYQKVMDLGRLLTKLSDEKKIESNRVSGCQSIMFLYSFERDGKIYFEADSDALISAGLAALLIKVYSGQSPDVIIKADSSFLNEIGIAQSLTPSRANGLYSILLKMKQLALGHLVNQTKAQQPNSI